MVRTAVLTSSSTIELARTVSPEGEMGWTWTMETEGWRRVWPLTHSDLSKTGADFIREAEAIFYEKCMIWKNLTFSCFTSSLLLSFFFFFSFDTTQGIFCFDSPKFIARNNESEIWRLRLQYIGQWIVAKWIDSCLLGMVDSWKVGIHGCVSSVL